MIAVWPGKQYNVRIITFNGCETYDVKEPKYLFKTYG
jgi:hypothetical protein